MTPFRDLPIRRKMSRVILAVSISVLLLTGAAFMSYEWLTFRSRALGNLTTVSRIVADNSSAALRFQSEEEAGELLESLRAEGSVVFAGLYDPAGRIFTTYPAGQSGPPTLGAVPASGHRFDPASLWVYEPVMQDGQRYGTLVVQSSLAGVYRRFWLYGALVLLILAGSTFAAFILSSRLQRRITDPIRELADTARAIAAHRDFELRATRYGNDELGGLTDSFNHMLSEIRTGQHEIQRLNADLERRVEQRTIQLHQMNMELEAFTYSVSHDLRAPLRHVSGYAQAVREDPDSRLSDEARHFLGRIAYASEKLSGLVDSLLRLSRVGRQSLSCAPTDLNQLVDTAIAELDAETRGRRIAWAREPLPVVDCDPTLIAVVFVNLISNALKYSRPRPEAVIAIGFADGGSEPAVFVRDNGVGFDPAQAGKLFGVFERLHREADFEGHGVGLATAWRIVRNHGGRIWAESRPGEGATFYFNLPGMGALPPLPPS